MIISHTIAGPLALTVTGVITIFIFYVCFLITDPGWAIGLAVVLTMLFTILLMIIVPKIIKRVRNPGYGHLRDMLEPVDS